MIRMKLWAAIVIAFPLTAFAAAESGSAASEPFRAINPAIDSWAAGTISNVDAKTGEITIHGKKLPYASAHAEMRAELRAKLAGIDDKLQRRQVAEQVHKAWTDRLQAALESNPGAALDFTFKQPADANDAAILEGSDIRQMPFFQKFAASRQKHMKDAGEAAAVESALSESMVEGVNEAQATSYKAEAREKAGESREKMAEKQGEAREKRQEAMKEKAAAMTPEEKEKAKEKAAEVRGKVKERIVAGREKLASERLSLSELKKGDLVLVGFDKDTNSYFSVIRRDANAAKPQPVAAPEQPATVK